jgi:hypothetical protein
MDLPLSKRTFLNVSWSVYYKILSTFIAELNKDFLDNELTINDTTKPFIIQSIKEKCEELFPMKMFPTLGEFTYSMKQDMPDTIIKIIFILRDIFQSYKLE